MFSKLDANSSFWQIPLAEQSRLLSTFITLRAAKPLNESVLREVHPLPKVDETLA